MKGRRVKTGRVRMLRDADSAGGPVAYWMSRDQRVQDNWALLHAQDISLERKVPLVVVFCLASSFLGATIRQYGFLLKGLAEVEQLLRIHGIPFFLIQGDPGTELPRFVTRHHIDELVMDFDPLKVKRSWKARVAERTSIALSEVDAHNIVPCWAASPKQEYGAYTLRPRLRKMLPDYLDRYPTVRKHPYAWSKNVPAIAWKAVERAMHIDRSVPEVDWIVPGEGAARTALRQFIKRRLSLYADERNDPNCDGQSGLSPYLHFGQLSAQRVAMEVMNSGAPERSKEAFLEELITRREVADNFCYYNRSYDSVRSLPAWAQATLQKHGQDRREYHYTLAQFEQGRTHDDLWNAAQREMVIRGKMHGYIRMYWAKKILEWTRSPERAMKVAIFLNDRYELDGRDPNGYAGIAWSIGGLHDRPWGERKIFGMVRYMSYNGCRSKFDVQAYIEHVKGLK